MRVAQLPERYYLVAFAGEQQALSADERKTRRDCAHCDIGGAEAAP